MVFHCFKYISKPLVKHLSDVSTVDGSGNIRTNKTQNPRNSRRKGAKRGKEGSGMKVLGFREGWTRKYGTLVC